MSEKSLTHGIKFKDKIGYAMGDMGGLLTFSLIGAFQNKFYTDVLHIQPAKIVVLILVARLWDAINDPIWGAFIDSRKPTKQGKFRPYVFWFSIPLAVSAKRAIIAPRASMTVHPVRMTGLVVGAPQTYHYFDQIQDHIVDFVTENSRISRADFARYMMATGNMATDVGTVLYGAEAVESGLMDQLGSLSDALAYLHAQIAQEKKKRSGPDAGGDN